MVVKSAGLGEPGATVMAGVGLLAAVCATVAPECGDIREAASAARARVRLFPGVSAEVELEISAPGKRFVTLVAF